MVSAAEYKVENNKLMVDYERTVRKWLKEQGGISQEIADDIPFFRDGATCPEKWCVNDFRPLFILKEVSMGFDISDKNLVKRLIKYNAEWGKSGAEKVFEFAANPFDDVRVGSYRTWIRVAKLAKGLEVQKAVCDEYSFSFEKGGEKCNDEHYLIAGHEKNAVRTANKHYREIIDKIAVIDIKKIGGGTTTGSKVSKAGQYFTRHLEEPMLKLLQRQLQLLNPTVVICCGKENVDFISKLFKEDMKTVPWIDNYHPAARISNKVFFEDVIEEYKKRLI